MAFPINPVNPPAPEGESQVWDWLGLPVGVGKHARQAIGGAYDRVVNPPPAPPAAPPTNEYPPVPATSGAMEESIAGGEFSQAGADRMYQLEPPRLKPQILIPKHHDFTPVGGRELVQDALQTQPGAQAGLAVEQGQAGEKAYGELAKVYKSEQDRQSHNAGQIEADYQKYLGALQQRLAQVDEQANKISRHQIDSGRAWKNPGNVIAAIGAIIAGYGARDPKYAQNFLDSVIDREIGLQRQEHEYLQADKHNLETNVQMYRQLMGDKQAGDLVHEAKLRQAAAMKIEEISSQLKSQEARNNGMMIASRLWQTGEQLMMQANAASYRGPQMVSNPRLRDAQLAGDVTVYGQPQAAARPSGPAQSAPQAGGISQKPNTGSQTNSPLPPQPSQPVMSLADKASQAEARVKSEDEFYNRLGDRIGMSGRSVKNAISASRARINIEAASVHPTDPTARNRFKLERKKEMYGKAEEVAKRSQEVVAKSAATSEIQRANNELKRKYARKDGEPDYPRIDKFLMQNSKFLVGNSSVEIYNRLREAAAKEGSIDQSDADLRAIAEWSVKMNDAINRYGHEIFGGALTPEEGKRLDTVVNRAGSFAKIDSWVQSSSRNFGVQYLNAMTGVPLEAKLLYAADKGIRLPYIPSEGR